MRPAATAADKRPGLDDCTALMVEQQLRGRCVELAVFLHKGELPPNLLGAVVELTVERWALREVEDA